MPFEKDRCIGSHMAVANVIELGLGPMHQWVGSQGQIGQSNVALTVERLSQAEIVTKVQKYKGAHEN